ncbi:uncharacterized protein N7484_004616 [Penicillium longicatenatum]|uniref:uncharacterized protein n=1 Tax=Penicillium longicatenatum TaxID=1561947 RepID=UPI002546BE0D|nr:uncharacterized protein N7484_004616 [Penicillium longicatenatum]KAJ5650893.1 hypothetical protein N7484_004616 [Penicillium longicatenatum]
MASTTYSELCEEIYQRITTKLQGTPEDGRRFAATGTSKEVLNDDLLRRFFDSLELPDQNLRNVTSNQDHLIQRVAERDLYDFLATLMYITCSIHAARTFVTELVFHDVWPAEIYKLPVKRSVLADLFQEEVTPDKFLEHQACFCPVVIFKGRETPIENPDRQRLPYLEETFLNEGSFGAVYKVKIAKGHFYDPTSKYANADPIEIARKDYIRSSRENRNETLIMKQILSAEWSCKNIVESYGSLAVGLATYSLFMPLAMCDLWAYMMQYTPQKPEKAAIIKAAQGLANGLKFLHTGITMGDGEKLVCYHMDLKPKNILVFVEEVDGNIHYVWKISDFGMSRVKSVKTEKSGLRSVGERNFNGPFVRREQPEDGSGTMNRREQSTYLAPESISASRNMKTSSDVWSLGCVISVLFAYLEGGAAGVTRYSDNRVAHAKAEGYDRFFVRDGGFKPFQVNPEVKKWHDYLIVKARQRNPNEGAAVRLILEYLENEVFKDQSKRCSVSAVEQIIQATRLSYENLERPPMVVQNMPTRSNWITRICSQLFSAGGEMSHGVNSRLERMYLDDNEPFKGCEISPDGQIVAFWTDFKISIYTCNSLPVAEANEPVPVVKSADEFTISDCIWKSVSVTDKYLIASKSGGNFECYVFDLQKGHSPGENLRYLHHTSLQSLPEIKRLALSPDSETIVFILRDPNDENKPGMLYRAPVRSVENCQYQCQLDWPASDALQLFFATNDDIWIIFRPHLISRDWEHKIPILHICLKSKHIDPLTIELQGFDITSTVGIFTTLAPFNKVPDACAVITREEMLHIRSLDPESTIQSAAADIHIYRVLKLMMGWDDKRLYAVGKRSANHKMLLLEMSMPGQTRSLVIKELAELPGLSDDDAFSERLYSQGEKKFILLAALTNDNRRAIYRFRII